MSALALIPSYSGNRGGASDKKHLSSLQFKVDAEEKKRKQRKAQDIVAHFTLSFWVGLFNGKYAYDLWKPLRLAFPKMPKDKKKRANISNPLNRFRHIRNRVSHHEPICFDLDGLKNLYDEMKELLSWIDPELVILLKQIDNFEVAYNETKAIIS